MNHYGYVRTPGLHKGKAVDIKARRFVFLSVVIYIAIGVPLSLFHELGHASVCAGEGHKFNLSFDIRGGHTLCYGAVVNDLAQRIMGPVFGFAAAAGIYTLGRLKKWIPLLAVGGAFMVEQGAKFVIEGVFFRAYSAGAFDIAISIIQVGSWLGLIFYYLRKYYFKDVRK